LSGLWGGLNTEGESFAALDCKRYTKRCMMVSMARTNIDIDDELVGRAMRVYRLRSKREAVDLALRRLVGDPMDRREALAMEGSGWAGNLAEIRSADVLPQR
jgi:Arc/MetJ family transcription regulator